MKISYNWLKEFVKIDLAPEVVGELLTDTGLEVEKIEKVEEIEGGLEGLVIGKVESISIHPDADKLKLTKVNVGSGELLDIVCGAPNVDANQKVVVAQIGTTLYPDGDKPFKIKKSKIRGVESQGMLCAEDEIGLGQSHAGIIVLDDSVAIGTLAKDYYNVQTDYVFEIGLTPNRADAMSHFGVARDLLAVLKQKNLIDANVSLSFPIADTNNYNALPSYPIEVIDSESCPRYAGLQIEGVEVKESPKWLKARLKSIGLNPINNIVDVTNYIMHHVGQPLHAFDSDKIEGGKVVVKNKLTSNFETLDEQNRTLDVDDLMICDASKPMCIAGVFGGAHSGVSSSTKSIFLESAYFNPVSVRKTAKRHGLNTDASFRFERGIDPNKVVESLILAAELIVEVAGGEVKTSVNDIYPNPIHDWSIEFKYDTFAKLSGVNISNAEVNNILLFLDYKINHSDDNKVIVEVPAYRVDVLREADLVEEVLRIYGFNQIPIPEKLNSSILTFPKLNKDKIKNVVSNLLSDNGFNEIMSNSLTSSKYVENFEQENRMSTAFNVPILNPLSSELDTMRQSLIFGALEAVSYNFNRQTSDLKFYEFGKTYTYKENEFDETENLVVVMTGNENSENWNQIGSQVDFYSVKKYAELIIKKLGIYHSTLSISEIQSSIYAQSVEYKILNQPFMVMGELSKKVLKNADIKKPVFAAELNWDVVLDLYQKIHKIKFEEISKFPSMRRDLSLLVDKNVNFEEISEIGYKIDRKILKNIGLFDVYEGDKLPEGKKSYAVNFFFKDENKTLKDNDVNKIMEKIIATLNKEVNAEIR